MYFFTPPFVWVMITYWDLNRIIVNVQLFALNAINQFTYDWIARIWNDTIDFVLLVIERTWNGICGGAEDFEDVVDCTGFNNFLIVIEILATTFHQYFIILMLILQLIFAALQDSLCSDIECSNLCETPTCTSWSEIPIYNKEGVLLTRPGPLGVNWLDYLSETEIYYAQILANIITSFLQWLIGDVLPFWVQITAFMSDIFKLLLLYYSWIAIWVIKVMSKLMSKLSYIIIRAFYTILNNVDDKAIIFRPEYYLQNITNYAEEHQNTVQINYIDNYMNDYTELFLLMPNLPGNKNFTNTLINIYFNVKLVLDIIFEIPLAILQAIDKIICSIINLPFCIGWSDLCDILFKPPVDCIVAASHMNCQDFKDLREPEHPCSSGDIVALDFFIKDFHSLMGQTSALDAFLSTVDDCKSYITGEYFDEWGTELKDGFDHPNAVYETWNGVKCISATEPLFYGAYGSNLCTPELDICENPYIPAQDGRCYICLTSSLDYQYFGDLSDAWVWSESGKFLFWCSDIFRMESGGILFADKIVWKFALLFVDDLAALVLQNFWFDLASLSKWFWTECHDLLDPIDMILECPCIACEVNSTQILYYLDWIPNYKGFPCNPNHPDPSKSCCIKSPYMSILWFFDSLYEFFNGDLFDECNICPTPIVNNKNETCSFNPVCTS
jgi:hypothetical protein